MPTLAGCSSSGTWGWYVIDPTTKQGYNNIRFLLNGFGAAILLSIIAAVLSMCIGLIVAFTWACHTTDGSYALTYLHQFIRSIPLLPMLFWVFFGLPVVLKSMGINANIDAFWGAIITLAISDSAFMLRFIVQDSVHK